MSVATVLQMPCAQSVELIVGGRVLRVVRDVHATNGYRWFSMVRDGGVLGAS